MSFQEKSNQIFTVGLTGGIGAGKSTVGRVFETLGIPRLREIIMTASKTQTRTILGS